MHQIFCYTIFMNTQLLEENKIKLIAEQARLKKILGLEGKYDGNGEFPGEYKPKFQELGDDEGENALEVQEYETSLGVTRDMEIKLTKVEAALKRIAEGTYTVCRFGDEIEEDRLNALPEADTCIKHAESQSV